jgi:hypothetical protein
MFTHYGSQTETNAPCQISEQDGGNINTFPKAIIKALLREAQ